MTVDKEVKFLSGRVLEVKQEDRNGIPIGIIKGHAATFDIDRGNDRFVKGAFIESIQELRQNNRPVRMLFQHRGDLLIGGFPIESVREDEKGLAVIGEINLEVQEGREAFALAKQGILTDFSIGFSVVEDAMEDGIRIIKKAIIWEFSLVSEPMNPKAVVTEVKTLTVDEVKALHVKELEKVLRESGNLSKQAAKYLVSKMKEAPEEPPEEKAKDAEDAAQEAAAQEAKDQEAKDKEAEVNAYWQQQRILADLSAMKDSL